MARIAPFLEAEAIVLRWQPIDVAGLRNWPRGAKVEERRRENAARVARELEVDVVVPGVWADSRRMGAAALAVDEQHGDAVAASFRERAFSAHFEERLPIDRHETLERCLADQGLALSRAALIEAELRLESETRGAAESMVSGVPTFMLGRWPVGGIQSDDTMRSLLGRFAAKQRADRNASS